MAAGGVTLGVRATSVNGVTNGGGIKAVEGTFSFVPANSSPSASNDTAFVIEDIATVLVLSDFGTFADPDIGDTQSAVVIVSLPVNGTLTLTGSGAVTAGQTITVADINANKLVYTPASNHDTDEFLTFKVKDSSGTASTAAYTLTLDITPVNDNPVAGTDDWTLSNSVIPAGIITPTWFFWNDTDVDSSSSGFMSRV